MLRTLQISIGTVSQHGLSTGQRAILTGIQSNTAANGDQRITVTDATHFTSMVRSGTGITSAAPEYAAAAAWRTTTQAAQTALSRSLAAFYTQDDDPTINGSADADYLASLIKSHIESIRTTVLAGYSGAKFELLWPYDVNFATCYYVPYPQGGRLNRSVNLPSQCLVQSGSGLDPQGGVLVLGIDIHKRRSLRSMAKQTGDRRSSPYYQPRNEPAGVFRAALPACSAGSLLHRRREPVHVDGRNAGRLCVRASCERPSLAAPHALLCISTRPGQ